MTENMFTTHWNKHASQIVLWPIPFFLSGSSSFFNSSDSLSVVMETSLTFEAVGKTFALMPGQGVGVASCVKGEGLVLEFTLL